ncbi:MAG: Rrf2 family transcriptional regulator [Phycisphaerales bacterium]|nr:Rrf2 family transcriptional regulator [Phycisphaerales bacterium]
MLSRTTEYALRAVIYLAKAEGDNATSQAIAAATVVPEGYMSKVLNTLARAGIVSSQRGPTGGFALALAPNKLTMLDVVEALEPLPRINSCPLALTEHAGGLCPLHSVLAELVRDAEQRLGGTTISDLLVDQIVPLNLDKRCDFPPGPKRPEAVTILTHRSKASEG